MNDDRQATRRSIRGLRPLLWVAASFLVFFTLFFDPLDLHPVDAWLAPLTGAGDADDGLVEEARGRARSAA